MAGSTTTDESLSREARYGGHAPEAGRLAMLSQPAVRWGVPIAEALQEIVHECGARTVLPVVTSSLSGHDRIVDAIARLGSGLAVFSALKPHTPFEVVCALLERIVAEEPDMVVVIGGGSATDAAKVATAAAAAGARSRDDVFALRSVPDERGAMTSMSCTRAMPLVAVPTTLSAAEFGIIAGATDSASGTKHLYRSPGLAPEHVIYDPWLALATPADLWLSTGIRALDHGIEAVLSIDATPFTDALALKGISLLRKGLEGAREADDAVERRTSAQLGAWLCGASIGRVRYGASHGLGHQLGAVAGVPHGLTSCVLLPAVLSYNEPETRQQQRAIADAMGKPGSTASAAVRDFIASLGLPVRLSSLEVDEASLTRIAESSLGNAFVRANPRRLNGPEDILEILRLAL